MIDKIFDLGEKTVREIMVPLVDVAALPASAPRPSEAVRLIAERGFSRIPVYTDRVFNWSAWSPPWTCCGAGPRRPTSAPSCGRPLRPGDQADRRPPPRDAEGPRSSSRWWWTSTAARWASSPSRTSSSRSWARSRTSTTARPATVERLPDGSYRVAGRVRHRRAQRVARLGAAQGRLRDGGRARARHRQPDPRGGRGVRRSARYEFTVLEADERRILTVRDQLARGRNADAASRRRGARSERARLTVNPQSPQPEGGIEMAGRRWSSRATAARRRATWRPRRRARARACS